MKGWEENRVSSSLYIPVSDGSGTVLMHNKGDMFACILTDVSRERSNSTLFILVSLGRYVIGVQLPEIELDQKQQNVHRDMDRGPP